MTPDSGSVVAAAGRPPAAAAAPPSVPGRLAERVCAVLLLAVSVAIAVNAESLVSHSSLPRSGSFPPHAALWLGSTVLGLSSLAWLVQLRKVQTPREDPCEGTLREALAVFAILGVGAISARWLGLLLAGGVAYVAVMHYYRDRSKVFVLVSCVVYLVLLHYAVEVLLRVPLPRSPYLPLPL